MHQTTTISDNLYRVAFGALVDLAGNSLTWSIPYMGK